jgi:hypothetical protein
VASPNDLYALCQAMLDDVVLALDSIPDFAETSDLEGAPERQFVSPGIPVNDFVGEDCCSQVAVWSSPLTEADTTPGGLEAGKRASRHAWINHVSLRAGVSRCIPSWTSGGMGGYIPPSPGALNESSRQFYADGWALWNHLHNLVQAETLVSLCSEVFFDGLNAAVPAGGCIGWVVSVRAALDGYEDLLGS